MTQVAPDISAIAVPPDGHRPVRVGFRALTLGSIGVVYGDIGTSPACVTGLREITLEQD